MDKDDPKFWIGLGGAIAVIGFLMLDRYVPKVGIVWNVMNGMVFDRNGVPYRYILTGAVCCVLYGAYLWNKKQKPN